MTIAPPTDPDHLDEQTIATAVQTACARIAPLWPLEHVVAVNPFLGLDEMDARAAAERLAEVAGARCTMPRAFYAAAIADGRITTADLAGALAAAAPLPGLPGDVTALRAAADSPDAQPPTADLLPTVADAAPGELDLPGLVVARIAEWAAAHWDRRQSSWAAPGQDQPAWTAWRTEAQIDRAPELAGIRGFRAAAAALPVEADAAIAACLRVLAPPADGLERYLHRLLMSVTGWAGYARYLGWTSSLRGEREHSLRDLLAIRLAWECILHQSVDGAAVAWERARRALQPGRRHSPGARQRAVDQVLHSAWELAWQRRFLADLHAPQASRSEQERQRPSVQAAFCIDVRSEVFRRALETVAPSCDTLGFAGFFGMPIEYVPLGHSHGGARCPALIPPQVVVREGLPAGHGGQEDAVRRLRLVRRRARKAWKSFKLSAVASFGFVEAMGLGFAGKLISDSLGFSRPATKPGTDGVAGHLHDQLGPDLACDSIGGRACGLDPATRIELAAGALSGLGLGDQPARLVLLAGHGASSVNNPHATGLDCGACGGHSGEANARVAAAVLNDAAVRAALAEQGRPLPADTVFVPALHDTTTDQVRLFDIGAVPASHTAELQRLQADLAAAGRLCRAERAARLGIDADADVDARILQRARDWSQVRPEWGLAGCGAFVVAPRQRTAGRDLGGRCFLHSYRWQDDADFALLEQIMTAPMVVTSWINLQYFASTVDNRVFGCGDKTLHNVVGTLGVVEGSSGDLRPGLAWQSLHDGRRLMHDPVRLSVVIEAPIAAMHTIIGRHAGLQRLVDGGWLHLFAMNDAGQVHARYQPGGEWLQLLPERIGTRPAHLVA